MATPSYTTRTLTIPAGGSIETYRAASFITCLKAQAPFKIGLDGQALTDFEAGLTYSPENGLQLVELRNPGATDNTVTLAFGKGAIQDSRLTLGGSIAANIEAPDTFTTPPPVYAADGAATLLAAANGNRAELILVNNSQGRVFVAGSAAAVAGQGLPLEVGQSMVLTTTAAVYIRNDSGGPRTINFAETERGS